MHGFVRWKKIERSWKAKKTKPSVRAKNGRRRVALLRQTQGRSIWRPSCGKPVLKSIRADERMAIRQRMPRQGGAAQGSPAEKPSVDITPAFRATGNRRLAGAADVSIDEYMSRLLARSRGDSVAPHARSRESCPHSRLLQPLPAAPVLTSDSASRRVRGARERPKPGESIDLSPRAVAPERQVDLQAMRQLGNLRPRTPCRNTRGRSYREIREQSCS